MPKLLFLLFIIPLLLPAQDSKSENLDEAYREIERFINTLETVRSNHPDLDKLSYKRLIDHALEGVLGSLDRHSGYYHSETQQFIKENGPNSPHIESLGLTLAQKEDKVYIDLYAGSTTKNGEPSPAVGDIISQIGDKNITSLKQALNLLKGSPGQLAELTLTRQADRESYPTILQHRFVYPKAVTESFLLKEKGHPTMGYLHLNQFTATCHRELEANLDELEDQGMNKLILDFRQNPGGLLSESVKILGEFLPPSTEVVWTKGQNGKVTETLKTPERRRKDRDYPLVILLDSYSASASELVAAALSDLKRATIVGETSYGKGSVQKILPAGGGSTLRLTMATYHTPSGKTPHEVGVIPDHQVPLTETDRTNFKNHLIRHKLSSQSQSQLKTWQDPTLQKAIEVLK